MNRDNISRLLRMVWPNYNEKGRPRVGFENTGFDDVMQITITCSEQSPHPEVTMSFDEARELIDNLTTAVAAFDSEEEKEAEIEAETIVENESDEERNKEYWNMWDGWDEDGDDSHGGMI